MSAVQPPLEIILKFTSSRGLTASSSFSWEEREYLVEDMEGAGVSVRFPWHDPQLRQSLKALEKAEPGSEALERLGRFLRDLLRPTHWALEEQRIEVALNAQPPRPVHLTIRSANADELYYLPWELLPTKSGIPLAGLENCLLRYECVPVTPKVRSRTPQGRILFAWSGAGGWVPAAEHEAAIRKACERVQLRFDPKLDVLNEVTRKRLVERLNDPDRPVTALHLLCHGTQVADGAYGLAINSTESSEPVDRIDATELRDLIFLSPGSRSLRLVTLCSCQGGDAGTPAHLLGGVARMFHQQGVPAVVSSRMPLTVDGSNILTETLYEGLLAQQDMRSVLHTVRSRLRSEVKSRDWVSLQFYAKAGDATALTPFSEPPPPAPVSSSRKLIIIRHEAHSKVSVDPEPADAPALFAGRQPRWVAIEQTQRLAQRDWRNLQDEVSRLAATDGELRRAYEERDADVAYYGFPLVPLAALAGHLAKHRPVHALEYVSDRYRWEAGTDTSSPPMEIEVEPRDSGSAARLRVSVSAPVSLDECREVLPDSEVALDLHFKLPTPRRGSVRREEQLKAYMQKIQDTLDEYISGNPPRPLKSVHVFAAVPVSVAFHLGRALAATWMPECFVYNYGRLEKPAYKWRLSLQAAEQGRRSVKIFK
ncbi:SAVED domain-containing protein [Pyxidicoccus sp. MSG2]|uniref:SAVED domain-containing protein n=1 Tax=Pyxidicoccus sp. MSG2 TaxID=2996790 RepID=UPI002270829C|nr:SAVED domain-containing protein [Pyxidicoccus sp. MSG2]MCY1018626.1 SAVED domain-containing protein [Pyxidicoccus sp. MSG2]